MKAHSVRLGVAVAALFVIVTMTASMVAAVPLSSAALGSTAAPAVSTASPVAAAGASAVPGAVVTDTHTSPSGSPHPGTLDIYEVAPNGATSEDPAVAYDTVSYEPILNVDETLATYNGDNNTSAVPVLATCVPGTTQCVSDYGSTLIYQANGAQYTGATGEPIYWTFVIDSAAKFYDPSTGKSWGVYPTDVMFSEAREAAWASLIGVGSTAGWLTAQALLPNGNATWDDGIHSPYNNTPGQILGSMFINDSAYCPAAAMANAHGCITFNASGGGSDWPFFLQLIDDGFAGAVVPCGWYTYESAGIPGWAGTKASAGDGPCAVPQLGSGQSTTSAAWQSYLGNLSSASNHDGATNMTSWDGFEKEILNYPAPQPNVQWNVVGSGPYSAKLSPTANPPGYALTANPAYAEPSGCSGAGGLAVYSGVCYPAPGSYMGHVQVYYESSDAVGISEYRAGQADFATILPPETGTLLTLADEGKLNYFVKPSLSNFFLPINLEWSASSYGADSLPSAEAPNIPSDFFSGEAARSLLTSTYPYAEAETTAWTLDGIPYLYEAGGPIAKGMGTFYPANVTFPYQQNGGVPNTNPSVVGGAAWWWAQGTNPSSPYYDPDLAACLTHTCSFPLVGQDADPGLDTAISEWIGEIESITDNHVQPTTFDLPFGGAGSLISDQLVAEPGNGPLPVWNLGWAPDNFDPQDYMVPMAYPNSTYTLGDAVWQAFNPSGAAYKAEAATCGHATNSSNANLVYWYDQTQIPEACQGIAYDVATWWNEYSVHVANLADRVGDYADVDGILNALSLYAWIGQANQVTSFAPWIAPNSVNYNPAVGGGGDQMWFEIKYLKASYSATFSETGLPTGTAWSVTLGSTTLSSTTGSIDFTGITNGTYPFEIGVSAGYAAAPASGNLTIAGTSPSQPVTFTALATPTYPVSFAESGLVSNTTWSVVVRGEGTLTTNLPNQTIELPNGTYSYYPPAIGGYGVSPAGGSFTVANAGLLLNLSYVSQVAGYIVYNVTFAESGLPAGAPWAVNLSSATTGGFNLSTTGRNITFGEPAGAFSAAVFAPAGYVVAAPVISVSVTGNMTVTVPITKAADAFPLHFDVSGLPANTPWSISIPADNLTVGSTGTEITFTLPNGTIAWTVSPIANYVTTTPSGFASVNGATTKAVTIVFAEYTYAVTFFEGGLPSGASWSVTVNSATTSSTGASLSVNLANGTYTYSVTPPTGYEVVSSGTSISVNGASNSTVVVFAQIPATYSVTFTETGLPVGASWTVAFGGTTQTSTVATGTTTISFTVANGAWSYGVTAPSGYTAASPSGVITVSGAAASHTVAFSAVSTSKSSPSASYLSTRAYELIGALAVIAVIGFGLAAVMARRRPPASPPPKGWSESPTGTGTTSSSDAGAEDSAKS